MSVNYKACNCASSQWMCTEIFERCKAKNASSAVGHEVNVGKTKNTIALGGPGYF